MTAEVLFSGLALLASALAALYVRWTVREAKNANDMGRLNAMLTLQSHYLEQLNHQAKLADNLYNIPSGLNAARDTHATLDAKLREVSREIDKYHNKLVCKRT